MAIERESQVTGKGQGFTYRGEALRHVAMPLGGLGAGQVALCGDGGLRQWQIVNQANHLGFVPHSFFAIRASSAEPPLDVLRILQSQEIMDLPPERTPLVNDNVIPREQRALLDRFSGVERTGFEGAYPFARITYDDTALPVDVTLESWCPFVPLDAEASGLPAILFTFDVRNRRHVRTHGCLAATLQNAVGWDGVTPITGSQCPLYGGNVNRVRWHAESTSIVMDNPSLPDDHPGFGQMVLAALSPLAHPYERWTEPEQFIRFMHGFNVRRQPQDPDGEPIGHRYAQQRTHENSPNLPTGPSGTGETWNGGLVVPFDLDPEQSAQITFVIAWHFPNRYVNFDQFGRPRDYGKSHFWLGNAYARRFADAIDVMGYVRAHHDALESASRAWADGIFQSTLPDWMAEALAAQACPMRSPTCFWTADGRFFGFEGCLGASTTMWNGDYGGSCPLNCTHVWNYEQALSRLFPQLERTMRETDLEIAQAPEGYIPHRVYMPLYLPQLWEESIGGPDDPALDGMLGTVLKVYREVRQGADRDWLNRLWGRVKRLMLYIENRWDPDRDGVLTGKQPNTYDISFYGANMFIGGLWLAALQAAEQMALLQEDMQFARDMRETFERGSAHYDALLWNGEYYIQVLEPDEATEFQYGDGCLSDQLLGQWWAHLLDLGYILPRDHVVTALQSIWRYNLRRGFSGFEHNDRVFADCKDSGLLVCTWPHGGRPEVPIRYADEVWTGIEYQVASHAIIEGLVDEGFEIASALRARYAGDRRNPYNEIECGDHYVRSMAGWSLLEAVSGFRYNAVDGSLRFAPVTSDAEVRLPFLTGTGWGTFEQSGSTPWEHVVLRCAFGEISIQSIALPHGMEPGADSESITVTAGPHRVPAQWYDSERTSLITFEDPVLLRPGTQLEIVAER